MKPIILLVAMALGNGARKAGFQLGQVADPNKALVGALEYQPKLAKLGVKPAQGVTDDEVLCALRNPLNITFDTPESPVILSQDPDAGSSGDDTSGDDGEEWRAIKTAEAKNKGGERIPTTLLQDLTMGTTRDGKPVNLPTLGELFDFGEANEGFITIKGVGNKTDEFLRGLLADHVIENDAQ